MGDLQIYFCSCSLCCFFCFFPLFEFSLSCLSFLFPSFYPLTTWAAILCYCHMSECQPPHHSSLWLARPFQVGELLPDNNLVWLLEQRCNWLTCSPCLGLGFWSSPVCVRARVYTEVGGWLLNGAIDKHTCAHIPRLTTQITHRYIYWEKPTVTVDIACTEDQRYENEEDCRGSLFFNSSQHICPVYQSTQTPATNQQVIKPH